MATYSISQVESITGISSHKLRTWERRYDFIRPKRKGSKTRYYTDEELRRLINIGLLARQGYKISKIDKLTYDEINNEVITLLCDSDSEIEDEISSLLLSTINLDENLFNHVYQRQLIRNGFIKTVTDLFYPFMTRIGILWIANKLIPAQEHFISNLIRQKIISAVDTLPSPPDNAKKIVLFLFEEESHELSLLFASFIAKNLGWKVYYLGQNVPIDEVITTCKQQDTDLMMTMITTPRVYGVERLAKNLLTNTGIPLVISGIHDNISDLLKLDNILYAAKPNDLKSILESKT